MRNYLIAGNWKMNLPGEEAIKLTDHIGSGIMPKNLGNVKVLVCPPFTGIVPVQLAAAQYKGKIQTGAQNCYYEDSGAYTGEISVEMIKKAGADFIIIGHSERRQIFGEDDALINKKVLKTLSSEMIPILCIGETLEERNIGKTTEILDRQLKLGLENAEIDSPEKLVIAYEPVWAIGTGVAATIEQVEEAHKMIRNWLIGRFGKAGEKIKILYGGSMKPANAEELLATRNVDGGLIGGASLKADSFLEIISIADKLSS